MMVRKVLLKRMQNWVRQLAEKLWQPSVEEESCRNTSQNKLTPSFAVSCLVSIHKSPLTSAECAQRLLH